MNTYNRFLHDTHFHLDLYENFNQIVNEIDSNKIYTICVTNLPVLFDKLSNKIESKYIKLALGYHPQLIYEYRKYIPLMWKYLNRTKYIGEVGLDLKNVTKEEKNVQISFFEELIENCNKIGDKILTIHSRGSETEVEAILKPNFNGKVILHWYSGSLENLEKLKEKSCFFSINYAMLKTNKGYKIINKIPKEKILLESDGPFVKINNKVVQPIDIKKTFVELSKVLEIEQEELKILLNNNFNSLLKND